MIKGKEIIIDGYPYSNLQLYGLDLNDVTVEEILQRLRTSSLKEVEAYYKQYEAKIRPYILIQASNVGEHYGNTTKFIAIPFSTKYNNIDKNFKDYIVVLQLDKTHTSYIKPYKPETISDKHFTDVKRWYNKDKKRYNV